MSGIHIGSEVVCVKRHSQGLVVVGKHYHVVDQTRCLNCGTVAVDVGVTQRVPPGMKPASRCICGMERHNDPQTWILEQLFAPIDLDKVKDAVNEDELELVEP